jgi:hypothetical protein
MRTVSSRIQRLLGLAAVALCGACMAAPPGLELDQWLGEQWGLATPTMEELWILSAEEVEAALAPLEPISFRARDSAGLEVPLKQERFDAQADVLERIAHVTLKQTLRNPGALPVDVRLRLPLPRAATLTDLVLRIGPRTIRAVVHAREDAERMYHAALRQGRLATLLSIDESRAFEQELTRLAGGETLVLETSYVHVVPFAEGLCELLFPRPAGPDPVEAWYAARVESQPIPESVEWRGANARNETVDDRTLTSSASTNGISPDVRLVWRPAGLDPDPVVWELEADANAPWCLLASPPSPADARGLRRFPWEESCLVDRLPLLPAERDSAWMVVGRLGQDRVRVSHGDDLVLDRRSVCNDPASMLTAVRTLWCQSRLAQLAERATTPEAAAALLPEARTLALDHGIATFLTSFVLVDGRPK